jgi:hypothetical protein
MVTGLIAASNGTVKLFYLWVLVVALGCSACSDSTDSADSVPAPGQDLWQGTWQRSDGSYQLIITRSDQGTLSAVYLNPSPINVQQVKVVPRGERQHLVVTLNDVGYPGAVYDLVYVAEADRLVGTYNNPNAGQVFDITFIRSNP